MGLYWVDTSISNEVVDIPRGRQQFFNVHWNRLLDIEKVCLQKHINNTIDWKATPDDKGNLMVKPDFIFAIETGQWHAPIMHDLLYKKMCGENFEYAGFMLGLLVYRGMYERPQEDRWFCIKTEFKNDRDWKEIFYWKDDNR